MNETRTSAADPIQQTIAAKWPSVNALAAPLVAALIGDAPSLRLGIERLANGCVVVDAGIGYCGGLEAGRRIAEICMAGLGHVSLQTSGSARWPWQLSVQSSNPVLACLGSQYAGWSLSHGEGKGVFQALGSGPGRAAAAREPLFGELAYRDLAESVCLVLEVDKKPPLELTDKIARHCGVAAEQVTLILTPTRSLAGSTQIVARVLEVALHKAHTLGFPLHQWWTARGPRRCRRRQPTFLPRWGAPTMRFFSAGRSQLFVDCDDREADRLAVNLPSSASKDYGKPFAWVFKDAEHDFYRIDPNLFAPAAVSVTALKSGRTFHAGARDEKLLELSFGS